MERRMLACLLLFACWPKRKGEQERPWERGWSPHMRMKEARAPWRAGLMAGGSAGQSSPWRPSEPRLCLWIPNLWTRPDNEQRERKLQIFWEAAERHGKTGRQSLAVSPVTLRPCFCVYNVHWGVLDVMVSGVCLAQGSPTTVRGPHPPHCLRAKNGFHIS